MTDMYALLILRCAQPARILPADQTEVQTGSSMSTPSRTLNYVAPVFRVADLNRSIAFYRDKLGFEVEFNYDGFYASVMRDGCRIHLNCCAPPNRDQQAFEAAEHIDICVGVNDAG